MSHRVDPTNPGGGGVDQINSQQLNKQQVGSSQVSSPGIPPVLSGIGGRNIVSREVRTPDAVGPIGDMLDGLVDKETLELAKALDRTRSPMLEGAGRPTGDDPAGGNVANDAGANAHGESTAVKSLMNKSSYELIEILMKIEAREKRKAQEAQAALDGGGEITSEGASKETGKNPGAADRSTLGSMATGDHPAAGTNWAIVCSYEKLLAKLISTPRKSEKLNAAISKLEELFVKDIARVNEMFVAATPVQRAIVDSGGGKATGSVPLVPVEPVVCSKGPEDTTSAFGGAATAAGVTSATNESASAGIVERASQIAKITQGIAGAIGALSNASMEVAKDQKTCVLEAITNETWHLSRLTQEQYDALGEIIKLEDLKKELESEQAKLTDLAEKLVAEKPKLDNLEKSKCSTDLALATDNVTKLKEAASETKKKIIELEGEISALEAKKLSFENNNQTLIYGGFDGVVEAENKCAAHARYEELSEKLKTAGTFEEIAAIAAEYVGEGGKTRRILEVLSKEMELLNFDSWTTPEEDIDNKIIAAHAMRRPAPAEVSTPLNAPAGASTDAPVGEQKNTYGGAIVAVEKVLNDAENLINSKQLSQFEIDLLRAKLMLLKTSPSIWHPQYGLTSLFHLSCLQNDSRWSACVDLSDRIDKSLISLSASEEALRAAQKSGAAEKVSSEIGAKVTGYVNDLKELVDGGEIKFHYNRDANKYEALDKTATYLNTMNEKVKSILEFARENELSADQKAKLRNSVIAAMRSQCVTCDEKKLSLGEVFNRRGVFVKEFFSDGREAPPFFVGDDEATHPCHKILMRMEDIATLLSEDVVKIDSSAAKFIGRTDSFTSADTTTNYVYEVNADKEGKMVVKKTSNDVRETENSLRRANRGNVDFLKTGFLIENLGIFGKNMASTMTQDMFIEIGKSMGITVPSVMARAFPAIDEKKSAYIGQEFAEGLEISKMDGEQVDKLRKNGEFLRQESWLQCMDMLNCQCDRHGDNVKVDGGNIRAFDHDESFPLAGSSRGRIGDFRETNPAKDWNHLDDAYTRHPALPAAMDEDQFDVITHINIRQYRLKLESSGLDANAIDGAIERTKMLIAHAYKLKSEGKIIKPNAWATSDVVKSNCSAKNFYGFAHGHGSKFRRLADEAKQKAARAKPSNTSISAASTSSSSAMTSTPGTTSTTTGLNAVTQSGSNSAV